MFLCFVCFIICSMQWEENVGMKCLLFYLGSSSKVPATCHGQTLTGSSTLPLTFSSSPLLHLLLLHHLHHLLHILMLQYPLLLLHLLHLLLLLLIPTFSSLSLPFQSLSWTPSTSTTTSTSPSPAHQLTNNNNQFTQRYFQNSMLPPYSSYAQCNTVQCTANMHILGTLNLQRATVSQNNLLGVRVSPWRGQG